ncbi:MAG: hypothetical protein B6D61_08100 [Bacteroidetes bacterium 4484_249]|nr:MAG: hypothetical protein B6D61_08100 [Bacteroidetes bacterium 4484_249]
MKKTRIVLSLIAGAMIIAFSCSKETVNNENTVISNKPQLSEFDKQVNKAINNFKQKMAYYRENPQLKSSESVPADSALWYLESTINYSHSFPNEYYEEFEVDTSYLNIPIDANGMVDMVVLTQKYYEMKTNVADDYHNSAFVEKGLCYVSISEVSLTSDELILLVESGTGEKNNDPPPPPPVNGPFGSGDNWWYGENAGKCEDATGEDFDAAYQLYVEAENTIPDPNGNYIFVGPFIEKTIEGGDPNLLYPTDPQPEDNHMDYYLYYASTEFGVCGDDTLCLEYPEMNNYFVRLKYMMYHYFVDKPGMEDYSIMCIVNFDDFNELYNNNIWIKYYHKGTLKFGKKIYGKEGEAEEL